MERRRVNLLFSGGRTSAFMVEESLKNLKPYFDFVVTFANTGAEHEETLIFVKKCQERWIELYNIKVVWLEVDVKEKNKRNGFKLVSFETASREWEPFKAVVEQYGLPNKTFKHCTRELKEVPVMAYMESIGETIGHIKSKEFISATYESWIGIRQDETKRLGGRMDGKQFKVHPLADEQVRDGFSFDFRVDKEDVILYWEDMPFDLNLDEHLGNCKDCHKKSNNKLFKVMRDEGIEVFSHSLEMDEKYSSVRAEVIDGEIKERKRYRGYNNTKQLIEMFSVSEFNPKNYDDESGGCSESCNGFEDNEPEQLDFINNPETWRELDLMDEEEQIV